MEISNWKRLIEKIKCISLLCGSVALWILGLGAGLAHMYRYETKTGTAASSSSVQWPLEKRAPRTSGQPTLVMVIHPYCPCSHASLEELNHLLARYPSGITVDVVVVQYAGMSESWVRSGNWRQAASLPGVHILADAKGRLAQRLGACTSGQTYLYNSEGRLLFSGGVTGGRGHEGENAGLTAVADLLQSCHSNLAQQKTAAVQTPVYGCPLFTGPNGSQGNDIRILAKNAHLCSGSKQLKNCPLKAQISRN